MYPKRRAFLGWILITLEHLGWTQEQANELINAMLEDKKKEEK